MWLDAILAYLHFIAIIGVGAHLGLEFALLRREPTGAELRRLARVDLSYGAAAVAALVTGGLRLAFGAKGFAFYAGNPVLYAKVGLFLVIGILSIGPTRRFIAWARAAASDASFAPAPAEVRSVRQRVAVQLGLFTVLPLLAVLLARGIGFAG
jgi:putative membrane protein